MASYLSRAEKFALRSVVAIIDVVTESEPKEAKEDPQFNPYHRFADRDDHRSGKKSIRTAMNCNGDDPGMNMLKQETTKNAPGKGVPPSGLASYPSGAEKFALIRLVAVIDVLRSMKA